MAQIHLLICFVIILGSIMGIQGRRASTYFNCTCRNNDNRPGIDDVGVTNHYVSGYGGGTCYVGYNPALSTYNNSRFFNTSGGIGTGYFTRGGPHPGNNGQGYYTFHRFTRRFTGITNFNYYLAYVFDNGPLAITCSSYCRSIWDECYSCCKFCCGGRNIPRHPFASDGLYRLRRGFGSG